MLPVHQARAHGRAVWRFRAMVSRYSRIVQRRSATTVLSSMITKRFIAKRHMQPKFEMRTRQLAWLRFTEGGGNRRVAGGQAPVRSLCHERPRLGFRPHDGVREVRARLAVAPSSGEVIRTFRHRLARSGEASMVSTKRSANAVMSGTWCPRLIV